MQLLMNFLVITELVAYSVHQWNKPPACFNGTQYPFTRVCFIEYTTQCCFTTWEASKTAPYFASIGSISPGKGYRHLLQLAYIVLSQGLKPLKDTFSCGPIIMKFAPHEICSITIPKSTDWTDCTAKVICPKMNNNLGDCQEGNGASTPKLSSNSIHTISPQINPKKSNFSILRRRLLQLWYMESYRNISRYWCTYCVQQQL